MKAEFLKLAGVKSEKAFYKKYPTEAAFFKAHPDAKKKAQIGAVISGGDKFSNPKIMNLKGFNDDVDLQVTGMTDDMRQEQAAKLAAAKAASESKSSGGGGGGDALGSILGMLGGAGKAGGGEGGGEGGGLMEKLDIGAGGEEGIGSIMGMLGGGARYGADIPQAAGGTNMNNWWSAMTTNTTTLPPGFDINKYGIGAQTMGKMQGGPNPSNTAGTPIDTSKENWMFKDTSGAPYAASKINQGYTGYQGPIENEQSGVDDVLDSVSKVAGPVGELWQGYQALRGERRARKAAEQAKVVSDITLKASQTRPEEIKRKYVRPEDIENTGEEFFPIYGVGTNVLARNGARLQDGGMVGGNPTEIQNTYDEGTNIYTNLEYEPLYNVNQEKSFRQGGYIPQAQNGFQNWQNSMSGGGSGFSGAGASGGTPWGAIGGMATNIGQTAMGGQNAGGQIGGTIGKSVGSIFGPAGGAIGGFVGGIAGNALDTNAKQIKKYQHETKRNITKMGLNSGFQSVNAGNASYVRDGGDIPNYEDGGYMNPEYNPQVITMFGDVNEQDFADFAHKDQFRAGGHLKSYTPPSERAMETFDMGGELETHWGGYAEPMSQNPYLPGTGQTVMFRGKSHEERSPNGETGIGITYGGNPVEVERGEPMVELQEGGTIDPETGEPQKSGVVFGNLKIPNQYIDLLGDPKAKGKKFKNYVADLSKTEEKQNKMIEKSTNQLDALDIKSSFDRLKLASLEANIKGGNMKLKDIADKKISAAGLQNAINDTAEEYGLVADDLARGKVKIDKEAMSTRQARLGAAISKAKDGITTTTEQTTLTPTFRSDKEALDAGYKKVGNEYIKITQSTKKIKKEKKSAKAMDNIPKQSLDTTTGLYGGVTPEEFKAFKEKNNWYDWSQFDPNDPNDVNDFAQKFNAKAAEIGSPARILSDELDPVTKKPLPNGKTKFVGKQLTSATLDTEEEESPIGEFIVDTAKVEPLPDTTPVKYKRNKWIDLGNQVLDYIRPTDQEGFDMAQLYPEMYALSSNQLEPVPTQGYQPELGVPYDISLQDQLNANQADYRAMQRIAGYNPAAQANLNAQKYQANQQVLGTQFRANQEMKDRVYTENRNILNQAKLTNLGIYDKQYERQAQALSNTKATTQAALNSISDKMAKNKLENRTLGIYENLYKYRYDKSGRAINMNGIFQPNIPTVGSMAATQRQVPVYDKEGKLDHYQLEQYDPSANGGVGTPPINRVSKNGKSIVKKNNKNSSIVKAIKNL